MAWTDELTLRELTGDEHVEAGANFALMRERAKILPPPPSGSQLTSLLTTFVVMLIAIMIVLERIGVVGPLHPK
jgi:hypothetical protein